AVEPSAGQKFFSVVCSIPATKPGESDVPIDGVAKKYPQAIASGESLGCAVCYAPPTDGTAVTNAELIIPVHTPTPSEIRVALLAGPPAPKLGVGPASSNVYVSADVAGAESGTRTAYIYNDGNGALQINGLKIETSFPSGAPGEVFSLASPPDAGLSVPAYGVLLVGLNWNAAKVKGSGANEMLRITYFDPGAGKSQDEVLQLIASDSMGALRPTADPGAAAAYAGAKIGVPIALNGSGSKSGAGWSNTPDSYSWNLAAKPAGSKVKLNVDVVGPTVSVTPDLAGTYRFELVVWASSAQGILTSAPAHVDIVVGN
ncbi:MAG: hypothetical protein R3F39_23210, partial [Myxococcota bacterium]